MREQDVIDYFEPYLLSDKGIYVCQLCFNQSCSTLCRFNNFMNMGFLYSKKDVPFIMNSYFPIAVTLLKSNSIKVFIENETVYRVCVDDLLNYLPLNEIGKY
jgi:hypothetical protein